MAFIKVEEPEPQVLPKMQVCHKLLSLYLHSTYSTSLLSFVFALTTPVSLVDFLLQKEMLIGDRRRDTERDSGASQAEELNFKLI